jgi:amino acid transporter
MAGILKRMFVGRPLATTQMEEQRLPKSIALAVFSSDALSSTAYASEEILMVTAVGGSSLALGLNKLVPIAIVVAALLAIVITSYRQVIFAYPNGGGAYTVSKENLGRMPSLVAAASLMVDYVLTVAVSISAGVAAIVSIPSLHGLHEHRVELGVALILGITLMNMRGIKESGRVFAIPTYVYVIGIASLIVIGLVRSFMGGIDPVAYDPELAESTREFGGTLTVFLLLKGFSSGAVALTGVEAISNGVPAFRRPEARNAATTLVWMGVLLGSLFFGISLLAQRLAPFPSHERTVIAQLGLQVFGNGFVFVFLQFATALILVLAANTAYNGFPSLSSIIAHDGYLPRQLTNRGDRLVFSNGILMLAGAAIVLLVAFGGVTTALIPLYAVGVFTSFTLSQTGMVRHHLRHRQPGWRRSIAVNVTGAVATFAVLMVVAITKFTGGAWVPIIVIPAIVLGFTSIHRHYRGVAAHLAVPAVYRSARRRVIGVVLVESVNAGALEALAYARSIRPDRLTAMSIVPDPAAEARLRAEWERFGIEEPLEVLLAPDGRFTDLTMRYLGDLEESADGALVNVMIPEFFVDRWWQHLLHNQSALVLKGRLLFRRNTAVTSIPYRVERV